MSGLYVLLLDCPSWTHTLSEAAALVPRVLACSFAARLPFMQQPWIDAASLFDPCRAPSHEILNCTFPHALSDDAVRGECTLFGGEKAGLLMCARACSMPLLKRGYAAAFCCARDAVGVCVVLVPCPPLQWRRPRRFWRSPFGELMG